MVYNERLLIEIKPDNQWFFSVDDQLRLMYAVKTSDGWSPARFTGISGIVAFDGCLNDEALPCLVCLERRGRLSCIVYSEGQWRYYPTASVPLENTTPDFLNLFFKQQALTVYSGFRREDGKLYTFFASRKGDTWTTYKPDARLYNKNAHVLSTLEYNDGIAAALLQEASEDNRYVLLFVYINETAYEPLFEPIVCGPEIHAMTLYRDPGSRVLCAMWTEDKLFRTMQNGRIIKEKVLPFEPEQLLLDRQHTVYVQSRRQYYPIIRDLSAADALSAAHLSPIRIFNASEHPSTYLSLLGQYPEFVPISDVPMQLKKKGIKAMDENTGNSLPRLEELEAKYKRLEQISAALSDQLKHFRSALLQMEDYMKQRDKALFRLETALGHPITPKGTSNKISVASFDETVQGNGKEHQQAGVEGLYVIKNQREKT